MAPSPPPNDADDCVFCRTAIAFIVIPALVVMLAAAFATGLALAYRAQCRACEARMPPPRPPPPAAGSAAALAPLPVSESRQQWFEWALASGDGTLAGQLATSEADAARAAGLGTGEP